MNRITYFLTKTFLVTAVFLYGCKEDELPIPEPPTDIVATAKSSSQIDLSWTDNSTSESGFKVERKTGAEEYVEIATTEMDQSTYSDNGLLDNATYTYRIFAFNSAHSTGEYSNEATATTNSVPQITTTVVSFITASTATSGGTITLEGGSAIIANGVVWSTSPNPTIELSTKTSNDTGSSSFESNVIDLNWETEYFVRAYATNSTGTGYGDEVTFSAGPISIVTTGISDITPFTALSGSEIGVEAGSAVKARGIVWGKNPNPTVELDTKNEDGDGTGSFTSEMGGLEWETEYYIRSYATNSERTTYGEDVTFTTSPIAITTEPVINIVSNSGTSGGTIDGEGGTSITARGLVWSISPDPTIEASTKTTDGTGTGNFTSLMPTLVPNTTYYLRAYVSNSVSTTYGSELNFITDELVDANGNIYPGVQIGSQVWMQENLKTTKYNDGSDIPNVTNNVEWSALTSPAYTWYNNDAQNGNVYGTLYNWYAVETRNLCPIGWHVPSEDEWTSLIEHLGGLAVAGSKLKEAGNEHWALPNSDATNESEFTALPGGARIFDPPGEYDLGSYGYWWTITTNENNPDRATYVDLKWSESRVLIQNTYKPRGHSIRCLSD